MKLIVISIVLATGLVCGDSTDRGLQPMAGHASPQVGVSDPMATGEMTPLFVHLISPRYYTDPPIPPRRIASTRIHLGKSFAVSVGEPSSASIYSVGGADPFSYSGDAVLAGRVEQRGNGYWGHMLGRSHTTLNNFAGPLELEKPVASQGGGFSGGIWSVQFVLSTNWDCRSFLKE
jgi:hypothetical protein